MEYHSNACVVLLIVVLPTAPLTEEVKGEGTDTLTDMDAQGVLMCGEGVLATSPPHTPTTASYTATHFRQ
jgi:hypothetical protein